MVFFPIWTQHTVQGCTLFVEIKFLNSQLGSSLASLLSMAIFAQALPEHLYSSKEWRVDSFESLPLSQQDFSDLDTLASLYSPPGHKEHTLAPGKEQGAGLWLCKPATTLWLLLAPSLAPSPSTLNEAKGKCFLESDTLQRQAFLSEQKNLRATVCCVEKHKTSHNLSIKIEMSKLYSSVWGGVCWFLLRVVHVVLFVCFVLLLLMKQLWQGLNISQIIKRQHYRQVGSDL